MDVDEQARAAEPAIHVSTDEKLVYMANQIADFFVTVADDAVAARRTADHIKSFWDPRMRSRAFAHVEQTDGEGLRPVALEALRVAREVDPAALQRAVMRNGGRSGREPGDDAG